MSTAKQKSAPTINTTTTVAFPRRPLMRRPEAARYLGVSVSYLDKARCSGTGPPFGKFGGNVLYDPGRIDLWVDDNTRTSTSAN